MALSVHSWLTKLVSGKKQTAPKAPTKGITQGGVYYNPATGTVDISGGAGKGGSMLYDPQKVSPPQVAGVQTNNPLTVSRQGSGTVYGSGGSRSTAYSGTGYSAPEPVDPMEAIRNNLKNDIKSKYNTLQSVFNSLFGDVDNVVKSKTDEVLSDYGRQEQDLAMSTAKAAEQLPSIFGARGLGSSSYFTNQMNDAMDIYGREQEGIGKNKQSALSQLGQFGSTQKARLGASKDAFGSAIGQLDAYDADSLASLQTQLQGAIGDAGVQRAGLMTDPGFIGELNKITPIQQQGTAQLAAKLQNLVQSAAPAQAKRYIASGLIKASTLNDANASNYWQSYFEQLLGPGTV